MIASGKKFPASPGTRADNEKDSLQLSHLCPRRHVLAIFSRSLKLSNLAVSCTTTRAPQHFCGRLMQVSSLPGPGNGSKSRDNCTRRRRRRRRWASAQIGSESARHGGGVSECWCWCESTKEPRCDPFVWPISSSLFPIEISTRRRRHQKRAPITKTGLGGPVEIERSR